jgi:hypothetical protein
MPDGERTRGDDFSAILFRVSRACDIVTVPDFTGASRAQFEARTLLFLACWLEYGGRARAWPLHLACIGDPPDTVRRLAAQCGARISVHAAVAAEGRGSGNKLRGLEVRGREERVLLLDVDVLILSDLDRIASLPPGLAISPAMKPRVPEAAWRRIYPALGLEAPAQRIPCTAAALECGLRGDVLFATQASEMGAMLPYYNSGVIVMPWSLDLRSIWERHIRTIAILFAPGDEAAASMRASDQAGLATAIEACRQQGTPVTLLPDACHAHWLALYRGTPPPASWELFHALFVFGKTRTVTPRLGWQLHRYRLHLMHRMAGEWRRDRKRRSRAALALEYLAPSLARAHDLSERLLTAFRAHAVPVLQQAGTP